MTDFNRHCGLPRAAGCILILRGKQCQNAVMYWILHSQDAWMMLLLGGVPEAVLFASRFCRQEHTLFCQRSLSKRQLYRYGSHNISTMRAEDIWGESFGAHSRLTSW